MWFKKGCNKVVIELRVVHFCSEIIRSSTLKSKSRCFLTFEITSKSSDQVSVHSVQLPLLTNTWYMKIQSILSKTDSTATAKAPTVRFRSIRIRVSSLPIPSDRLIAFQTKFGLLDLHYEI